MIRILQRWFRPLERTPLHPQWLVLRHRGEIEGWVKSHAKGTLVDVGCGNGRLRRALPLSVRYVGIDYPATVALGYSGAADILGDAAALPIADASVDVVALLDVLEHLPDPALAVGEAARILREGGKCLVHVPFLYPLHDEPYDYQRWTQYGLTRLFSSSGLAIHEIAATTHPVASAAALLSLALAQGVLDALQRRTPACLAVPFVVVLVVTANVIGWTMSRILPTSQFMSFSYRVVAVKTHVQSA